MRIFRRFALVALIVYATVAVGINFHSHVQGKDQFARDCKLCQVSQTFVEQATTSQTSPQLADSGFISVETVDDFSACFDSELSTRAPPTS